MEKARSLPEGTSGQGRLRVLTPKQGSQLHTGSAGLPGPQRVPRGTQYSQSWLDSPVALAIPRAGVVSFPQEPWGDPELLALGRSQPGLVEAPESGCSELQAGGGLG